MKNLERYTIKPDGDDSCFLIVDREDPTKVLGFKNLNEGNNAVVSLFNQYIEQPIHDDISLYKNFLNLLNEILFIFATSKQPFSFEKILSEKKKGNLAYFLSDLYETIETNIEFLEHQVKWFNRKERGPFCVEQNVYSGKPHVLIFLSERNWFSSDNFLESEKIIRKFYHDNKLPQEQLEKFLQECKEEFEISKSRDIRRQSQEN